MLLPELHISVAAMDWAEKLWIISLVLQSLTVITESRCSFPNKWHGTWYENGVGEIRLNKHAVAHKGHCFNSDHRKYLLLNSDKGCFVCLVFTPQHDNLLQYKESFCVPDDNLATVCSSITPDFTLHTMVKVSGQPIPCPFQGPYLFTYTNGSSEECKEPLSEIQACADRSRFIFSYRRCKGMAHTHDIRQTFQCLATWENGMDQLLYGRFTGHGHPDQTRMYRCFLYSKNGMRVVMTMSADATCLGLSSPELGMNSFSMQFRKDEWPEPDCEFPSWLARNSTWREVAGAWRLGVAGDGQELVLHDLLDPDFLTPGEMAVLRLRCLHLKDHNPHNEEHLLTFAINDSCVSTYRCVRIKQRAEQVFELKIGEATDDTYLGCEDSFFSGSTTHVFFPYEHGVVRCPRGGSYTYRETSGNCGGTVDIGCQDESQILVHAKCAQEQTAEILQCYQTWNEGSLVYVIAGQPGKNYNPAHCLVYQETADGFTLREAGDCGGEGVLIMNRPFDYVISTPKEACEQRVLPAPYHPLQPGSKENTKVMGSDVTSTSRSPGVVGGDASQTPTDLTKVNVINCSNTRTCAIYVHWLWVLLTLVLQER